MVHSTPKEAGETPGKLVSNVIPAQPVQFGNIFTPLLQMRNTKGQEAPEEGKWMRSGTKTATAADLKKAKLEKKERVKKKYEGILNIEDQADKLNENINARLFP